MGDINSDEHWYIDSSQWPRLVFYQSGATSWAPIIDSANLVSRSSGRIYVVIWVEREQFKDERLWFANCKQIIFQESSLCFPFPRPMGLLCFSMYFDQPESIRTINFACKYGSLFRSIRKVTCLLPCDVLCTSHRPGVKFPWIGHWLLACPTRN